MLLFSVKQAVIKIATSLILALSLVLSVAALAQSDVAIITDEAKLNELEDALKVLGYYYAPSKQLYAPPETPSLKKAIRDFASDKRRVLMGHDFNAHIYGLSGKATEGLYQLALNEFNSLSDEERQARRAALPAAEVNQIEAEIESVVSACATNPFHAPRWNCACIGEAYVKEREKRPEAPVSTIQNDLLGGNKTASVIDCFDTDKYAKNAIKKCQVNAVPAGHASSAEEALPFCTCVAEVESSTQRQLLAEGSYGTHAARSASSKALMECSAKYR